MKHTVIIAGAGGIGRAAGLLLREIGNLDVDLYIGDVQKSAAYSMAGWLTTGSAHVGKVEPFVMPEQGSDALFDKILKQADLILDCLPGNQAPRVAGLARQFKLHYANLTEYVSETQEVIRIAKGASTGFILQTGLAPGFVNVLANGLYQQFCSTYQVQTVESVNMKVGALTQNACPPHYYGFTWSPIGVATLYLKPATVIRDFQTVIRASLSERSMIVINGVQYEEDLTSGGAADLPVALAGKTHNLDYKTLRYPGHYRWIENLLKDIPRGEGEAEILQQKMEELIPMVEEDRVVIFASVVGKDDQGKLHSIEKSFLIDPVVINGKKLRAIQATTAAALVESARLLLSGKYKGCILQSQIDCEDFLNGPYVSAVYK
ncbi:MAG: saccharopine dehydrogenase C-terminal domain-containing protein [Calditrichia bacterium]